VFVKLIKEKNKAVKRFSLLDLLSLLPLRAAARDLRLGSGLTANRLKLL
jgi:hypothetical protein